MRCISPFGGQSGDEAKRKLIPYITETDDLHVFGRELYWLCRTKMGESQFSGARLEKLFGMKGTFRNSTTVKRSRQNTGDRFSLNVKVEI